jgi:hypothetical protein
MIVGNNSRGSGESVNRQVCPVCSRPAVVEWHQQYHANTVTCETCGSFSVDHSMLAELAKGAAGTGALNGRLETLSRALAARAMLEVVDLRQVVAELDAFEDD